MPNESWYVLAGGQQYGPYPLAVMEQFVAEGRVTPQTMLRLGETGAWAPAGPMLDFSHAPASAGEPSPGGFPPPGPMGYAPPPRSSNSTWIILAVVGGCLVLLLFCVVLPMLAFLFFGVSEVRQVHESEVKELIPQTKQVEPESNKAMKDFEIKGMKEKEFKIEWKDKDAKAGSPMDEPAVKPDGPKTPVEAGPERRSP
jgi:hypothetical protein